MAHQPRYTFLMLVYTATKATFLADTRANAIHEKIQRELKRSAHQGAARSQIDAWRNSMQFMASVLADEDIPADAGVSIEWEGSGRRKGCAASAEKSVHFGIAACANNTLGPVRCQG